MRKALVLALLLTGCATQPRYEWRHPHGDKAQFDKDYAQCSYEAAAATGSYSPNNRGYRTELGSMVADNIDKNQRHNEIGNLCMKARGYIQHAITAR